MKIIKRTQNILGLLLIINILMSCSKETDSVTPKTLLRIDKVTISDGTFRNYSYDALGRRSRIDYKDYFITYSYSPNTIIETYTYYDPTKTGIVYTHTLNAQGLASKRTYKEGTITYTRDVEHDKNGRIISVIDKSTSAAGVTSLVSELTYNYDSEGDLVNSEIRYASTPANNAITQYIIDKKQYQTTGVEFSGAQWVGTLSLHSWSRTETTRSNGLKIVMDFPRTYDTKGYILTDVNSYSINNTTGATTLLSTANYTYK